ncbi:hypothetical protein [Brevibacillus marinus]|uniref:hypothetical protein n=1 Tax=Brevibacillus marinus TaxID=2496837 RepID=UPI0013E0A100|nr:hypothetical protein [Brevibacillus marinus]
MIAGSQQEQEQIAKTEADVGLLPFRQRDRSKRPKRGEAGSVPLSAAAFVWCTSASFA